MYRKIFILLCIVMVTSCSYLPSGDTITPQSYELNETKDYIQLLPYDSVSRDAIFFIPGGLVDPHAYIDLLQPFVEELDMMVVIPKVRGNLAILNPKAVTCVRDQFSGFSWILGGHSLGGTLATQSIHNRAYDWSALFLLGSYSTVDISSYAGPVCTMRGSHDELTTEKDWASYVTNLPRQINATSLADIPEDETRRHTIYYTIWGGNHAQFGTYGAQQGDGAAEISGEDQRRIFFDVMVKILRSNGYNI